MTPMYARVDFGGPQAGSDGANSGSEGKSERFWGDGKAFRLLLGDDLAPGKGLEVDWFGRSSRATVRLVGPEAEPAELTPISNAEDWLSVVRATTSRIYGRIDKEVVDALCKGQHVLLVGGHGMGKSVFLKALCSSRFRPHAICSLASDADATKTEDLVRQMDSCTGIIALDDCQRLFPSKSSAEAQAQRSVLLQRALVRARERGCLVCCTVSDVSLIDAKSIGFPVFDRVIQMRAPQLDERVALFQQLGIEQTDRSLFLAERTGGWTRAELSALARTILIRDEQGNSGLDQEFDVMWQQKAQKCLDIARKMTTLFRDQTCSFVEPTSDTGMALYSDERFASARIAGMESILATLDTAVVQFLRSRNQQGLSGTGTRGVLLHGPSGNGKTLLGIELGLFVQRTGLGNFLSVRCLDLISKIVGETERNVARIFARARDCAPCVLFLDQLDAIAIKRGSGEMATTERTFERVLGVLLMELDGILLKRGTHNDAPVVVIATTRDRAILDPAIIRPGRLGTHIMVDSPSDARARTELLKLCTRETPLQVGEGFLEMFSETYLFGRSRAEIAGVCREAATLALRESVTIDAVYERHFLAATNQRNI